MDPRLSIIDNRLSKIKNIIAVASGKGGVGKSLVASAVALHLSKKEYTVGLLDLDLYGPSSHIILGVTDFGFPEEEKGILPRKIDDINFMSIVYFTEDKPAPLRGIDITNIIIEILAITRWGFLDYLIIDMPPGIGDEILDIIKFVKKSKFLVITTPSKVSFGAVNKLLKILQELNIPILGILENMKIKNFPSMKPTVEKMNISFIGSLTFDVTIEDAIGNRDALLQTRFMKELNTNLKKIGL
jgi:ATP-binding protein involved in chromosome partitioning